MGLLQSFICLNIIFLVICSSSQIYAQQPYDGKAAGDCTKVDNSTSVLGYTCNGQSPSCQAYFIFRSIPPYNTVSSISRLLASEPLQLSQINSVSETATFQTNKEVIVPINCSCSGKYYQVDSSYNIQELDTYFSVANSTYQALSTCQALQDQNSVPATTLLPGTRITVPLKCACPTKKQMAEGVKYLLTYTIILGDDVPTISGKFGVDPSRTREANELSEDATIYFSSPLLLPLQIPPSSSQTTAPPPTPPISSLPPPASSVPPSNKKNKTWVYIVIGVAAATVLALVAFIVIFCVCKSNNTKRSNYNYQSNITESFDSYEKPQQKTSEEESMEFLKSISDIAHVLKVYSIKELKSATENFNPNWQIKGKVYRGIISGNLAAIKKMNGDVTKELNVLKKINHFNLIKLSGVCFDEGHWYLVYEYAVNGSLDNWIFYSTQTQTLSWTQRVQIALDVAKGLNYLHSYTNPSHVHKDIKSSNILLDGDFRAKIANFGLARSAEGYESEFALTRHIVGTKGYMAPEYLDNGVVSPKLDVYSFGVVLLEMISGKEAVSESAKDLLSSKTLVAILAKENPGEKLKDLIDPSLQENYPLDLALSVAKLAESCLQRNPDGRPSMDDIVHSLARFLDVSLSWEISTGNSESYSFASTSSEKSNWKRDS
ncbi:hypothetical protein MKW98_025487 [Papaver atlanticum]|uniref:Protein kinase domain-containing protein n=1 Tax=Papaver atlanticum TaxID=357466 RepID=A0AAD4XD37_9MAGN|nr:hypothetical protein MKW98_025487 [Papaver atlanticum]